MMAKSRTVNEVDAVSTKNGLNGTFLGGVAMKCVNKKCAVELVDGAIFCHICGKRQEPEPKKHLKRANGTGTVYKLSGRRRRPWVAAKSGLIIGYYEKKSEAQDAVNALASKPLTERYNMTFGEVYQSWKKEHFRDLKSDKGIEGYETAYDHFSTLHNERFRELRTENYQAVIDKLIEKGRSHSTTNKLKQLVGQMSKWSIREEIITTNFAQFIKLPENVKTEKEIFTKDDIKNLFSSKDDAAKIILMLIYTGMRIGELFSMLTINVFEKYCIGGEKTEAGKNRIIPIPPDVRAYFAYFKLKAGDSDLLIEGYEGNHDIRNFRNRDYYGVLDDLKITRKSPHSTRHTYASMARDGGMKPEDLQKILGHADYTTTAEIYVHADVDALVAAAEKMTKKRSRKQKG